MQQKMGEGFSIPRSHSSLTGLNELYKYKQNVPKGCTRTGNRIYKKIHLLQALFQPLRGCCDWQREEMPCTEMPIGMILFSRNIC